MGGLLRGTRKVCRIGYYTHLAYGALSFWPRLIHRDFRLPFWVRLLWQFGHGAAPVGSQACQMVGNPFRGRGRGDDDGFGGVLDQLVSEFEKNGRQAGRFAIPERLGQFFRQRRFITIRAGQAKTASRRIVPVSANLRAWLLPHVVEGMVVPSAETYRKVTCLARRLGSNGRTTCCGIPSSATALRR